ncbi:MAG: hypothetical protein Kow0065_15650 [Methylomicrobium sp.]
MIDCKSGEVFPVPRPVSLKNESIDLIRKSFPGTEFSKVVHDTLKGSVALLKPPRLSIVNADRTAQPVLVVFPEYRQGSNLSVTSLKRTDAFFKLADLSFNYGVLGGEGFDVLGRLMGQCNAYQFVYGGNFNEASKIFDDLLLSVG